MCEGDVHFSGIGYKYKNEKGESYLEFYIDNHPEFTKMAEIIPMGGNLSVRLKPHEKPLIIFGQDKAIFKQYALKKKFWSSPIMVKYHFCQKMMAWD